jgi:hypothetical protein
MTFNFLRLIESSTFSHWKSHTMASRTGEWSIPILNPAFCGINQTENNSAQYDSHNDSTFSRVLEGSKEKEREMKWNYDLLAWETSGIRKLLMIGNWKSCEENRQEFVWSKFATEESSNLNWILFNELNCYCNEWTIRIKHGRSSKRSTENVKESLDQWKYLKKYDVFWCTMWVDRWRRHSSVSWLASSPFFEVVLRLYPIGKVLGFLFSLLIWPVSMYLLVFLCRLLYFQVRIFIIICGIFLKLFFIRRASLGPNCNLVTWFL